MLLLLLDVALTDRGEGVGASLVLRRGLEGLELGPVDRGAARAGLTTSPLPILLFFNNKTSSFLNLQYSSTSQRQPCLRQGDGTQAWA